MEEALGEVNKVGVWRVADKGAAIFGSAAEQPMGQDILTTTSMLVLRR